MDAITALGNYYESHDEANRLTSRWGQVEFLTTLRYIDRYLAPGMRVLDIGAGPGRYAHHLARRGYAVDAVELIAHNIEQFRLATEPGERVTIRQGDATALDFLPADRYDVTLLLGPLYHLFTEEDKRRALAEALRVTKPGGVVFAGYCLADASILQHGFVRGNVRALIENGLLDPQTFRTFSRPEDVFVLHRREDVDRLMAPFAARRLHYVGVDMATNYLRETVEAMDEETFALYLRYHFAICERADMVGASHHALDVFRKEDGLTLAPLTAADETEFLAMRDEFFAAGGPVYPGFLRRCGDDYAAFLRYLAEMADPQRVPPGYVSGDAYALKDAAGRLYGCCVLRHGLSEGLLLRGGHIGYGIRPSARGKGLGTVQLRLALEAARARGLARVLVTCDKDNPASARVIEKNGGRLENKCLAADGGTILRCRIDLASERKGA